MNSFETPLILFTVLSQLSIGLVAVSALQFAGGTPADNRFRNGWMVACGVLVVAMISSLFHLGHPLGMVRAVAHLSSAWLSREALSTGLLLALLIAGVVLMRDKMRRDLAVITCIVGLVTIISMGMTYAPPSFPALNNGLPFVFFILTAVLLGSSCGLLFVPESGRPLLEKILVTSLIVGLVVYLIVPCVWASGGEIMKQTSQLWFGSPLYWGRIIIGLAVPLAIIFKMKQAPNWLWGVILIGELMGRAVFFAGTVHTASHMGGLY